MKTIFVNPQLIEKINRKVDELTATWNYPKDQRFQLFQMVATIETGYAKKIFYWGNGLVTDGWNGYKSWADKNDPDPYQAWQGFYRSEPHQMVGWSIYMIAQADDDDKEKQARHCGRCYHYWFEWEAQPMVWGYIGYQDYYTEDEAVKAIEVLAQDKNIKSISNPEFSDISWMWRVKVTSTRKKPKLKHVYKQRVCK